jgi:DNA polymerase III delta prime subunit
LSTAFLIEVSNADMSKAKDILEMASKINYAGLNNSGKIIDAIVKNAKNEQKDNENVQEELKKAKNDISQKVADSINKAKRYVPISPIEG